MIESLWAGATTLASPGLRLLLRYRATRGKELGDRLAERRGIDPTPRPEGRLLWLHAASVGETISILPVIESLTEAAADITILVTTGTVTSATLLEQRIPDIADGSRVFHRFAPLDVPAWADRFLDHWRPEAACFVESELWPNILTACHIRKIPAILINARMSARSYAAWSRMPSAARVVLGRFSRIHARGEEDAKRLRALGASHVRIMGDLKLSAPVLPANPVELAKMRTSLAGRPVFLAASTHPGEEALVNIVDEALRAENPGLVTIIVPRHPERGPELAEAFQAPRRQLGQPPPDQGLWIADTLGELGLWYRLCSVVFVGRSLIPPGGGQNPTEPARLGCAIAVGPYTDNFSSHVALLKEAGALRVIDDVNALIQFASAMLSDPIQRRQMGESAKAAVRSSETLVNDTARTLLELMTHG